MKFACDAMLGRLARWLRMSGYDVLFRGDMDRAAFIRAAREDGRTILTRAGEFRELADIPPYHHICSETIDGQLGELFAAFPDLDPYFDFLSRCVECNEPLEEIEKGEYRELIPPKAIMLEGRFCRCPACGKLLWPGSHVDRIKTRLNKFKK